MDFPYGQNTPVCINGVYDDVSVSSPSTYTSDSKNAKINLYKMALQYGDTWNNTIHEVVYMVGTKFGFQAFNSRECYEQSDKIQWLKYTPASTYVVSDHIVQMLIKNSFVRTFLKDSSVDLRTIFILCLLRMHHAVFKTLIRWEKHIGLVSCLSTKNSVSSLDSQEVVQQLLCEISLYFLIWSEAANVRHLPEGICFLFWVLRNSQEFNSLLLNVDNQAQYIRQKHVVNISETRCKIRQAYQGLINQIRFRFCAQNHFSTEQILEVVRAVFDNRTQDLREMDEDIKNFTTSCIQLCRHRCCGTEQADVDMFILLIMQLALNQDGGEFTDRIILPIVLYLSVEMDLKGGWDMSQRAGYDDCNECFCDPYLIFGCVKELLGRHYFNRSLLYRKLLALGANPLDGSIQLWQKKFFKKQFVERRNWLMIIRAFFRVFLFHLCMFYILFVLGLYGLNLKYILTVVIIHSTLCAFINFVEAYLNKNVTYKEERLDQVQCRKHILVEMPSLSPMSTEKQLPNSMSMSRSSSLENKSTVEAPDSPIDTFRIKSRQISGMKSDCELGTLELKPTTLKSSRSSSFTWTSSIGCQKRRSQSTTIVEEIQLQEDLERPLTPDEHDLLNEIDVLEILQYQKIQYELLCEKQANRSIIRWELLQSTPSSRSKSWIYYLLLSFGWCTLSVFLLASFFQEEYMSSMIPLTKLCFINQECNREHWLIVSAVYFVTWAVSFIFFVRYRGIPLWILRSKKCGFGSIGSLDDYLVTLPHFDVAQLLLNTLFWIIVLTIKLAFDYYLLVCPLVDSINVIRRLQWQRQGQDTVVIFGHNTTVPTVDVGLIAIAMRCIPPFLVSVLDTGIFYIMVASCFGFVQGLMYLHLGLVNSWDDVVKYFSSSAEFWSCGNSSDKLCIDVNVEPLQSEIQDKVENNPSSSMVLQQANEPQYTVQDVQENVPEDIYNYPRSHCSNQFQHVSQQQCFDEKISQSSQKLSIDSSQFMQIKDPLDYHKWITFREVWNAIQRDYRSRDYISNHEFTCLSFPKFTQERDLFYCLTQMGIQVPYFPAFIYRHHLQHALGGAQQSNGQRKMVLCELKNSILWVLLQIGLLSKKDFYVWKEMELPFHVKNSVDFYRARARAISCLVKLLKHISQTYPHIDVHWLKNSLVRLLECFKLMKNLLEDSCQFLTEPLKQLEVQLRQSQQQIEQVSTIELPPHNVRELAEFLRKILSVQESAMVPKNPACRHMIYFFMSSLFNSQLPSTVDIGVSHLLSWTTLIPHNREDVLYGVLSPSLSRQTSQYDLDIYEGSHSWLPSSRSSLLGSVACTSKESVVTRVVRNMSFSRLERGHPYSLSEINADTDGCVSIMQYLQSVYPQEWQNFIERLESQRILSTPEIENEMVLWASYRGQLLGRTVRGMMCYKQALHLQATLENPRPINMDQTEYDQLIAGLISSKYSLIVSAQQYGRASKSQDYSDKHFVKSIERLLNTNQQLQVVYIDKSDILQDEYGVLIKGSNSIDYPNGVPYEIYRIRYPNIHSTRGVILGEGKPENQNHAIPFVFGDLVQTVDMNQDNSLGEALKMKSLIQEFSKPLTTKVEEELKKMLLQHPIPNVAAAYQVMQECQTGPQLGILGFREYVFSDRVGALGSFAAATEFAFGTLLQRVMAFPGAVRFHYGHPDVWDKLMVMTSGGVSKATRGFHISEDIFGGFNIVLRGYQIRFKEYMSIGKGREMRFDTVNRFEQKVSRGNGEQSISREVKRLGQNLDFFRLMSFYHSSVGFFLNTSMLMFSVLAHVWILLFLHLINGLADFEGQQCELASNLQGSEIIHLENRYNNTWYNSESFICQHYQDLLRSSGVFSTGYVVALGIFSMLPFTLEMVLEVGLLKTLTTTFLQLAAGAILFFIFKQQTSAYYFTKDLNHGGAQYLATGRGFALDRLSFVQVYSQFSRSHFYPGLQLLQYCVVLALLKMEGFFISTWGTWIVALALLFSPLWFNPFAFSLTRVRNDFEEWRAWTKGVIAPSTLGTWQAWNDEQLECYRNGSEVRVNFWMYRLQGLCWALIPRLLMIVAALAEYSADWISNIVIIFSTSFIVISALLGLSQIVEKRIGFRSIRIYRSVVLAILIVGLILYLRFYVGLEIGESGRYVKFIFAHLQCFLMIHNLLLFAFPRIKWIQDIVDLGYLLMDYFCGYLLFGVLFLFSFIQIFDKIQGALLFNVEFVKSKQRNKTLGKVVDQLRTFYDPDVINSPYHM